MKNLKLQRSWKTVGTAATLCVAVLAGTGLNAAPAKAVTIDPTKLYRIYNVNSGKTIDVENESTANGANIHQWQRVSTGNQNWRIQPTGDGYYKLVNANSGKVADVEGPTTANGANVHQWDYLGTDNQKWSIQDTGSGLRFFSKYSGKVMDSSATNDGAAVYQWDYLGTTSQLWRIEQVNDPLPGIDPMKYYKIKVGNQVMDVWNNSTFDGGQVGLYTDYNQDNQKWQIVPVGTSGNPVFALRNKNSGKNVSVPLLGSGTLKRLEQRSPDVSSSQWWNIEQLNTPGPYKIKQWGTSNYIFSYNVSELVVDSSMGPNVYNNWTFELTQ